MIDDLSAARLSDEGVIRSRIAERVREARKLAGLSQGQVARLMDMHRPTVSEIEAGNRRVSGDELARLAELFDVSVSWLVGEKDEPADFSSARVQLVARELNKLKPAELDRLLALLAMLRGAR